MSLRDERGFPVFSASRLSNRGEKESVIHYMVKNSKGDYEVITVGRGERFPTNGMALPEGTKRVFINISHNTPILLNADDEFFDRGNWFPLSEKPENINNLVQIWPEQVLNDEGPKDDGFSKDEALKLADDEFIEMMEQLTHRKLNSTQVAVLIHLLEKQ